MSIFDKVKGKVTEVAHTHGDKVGQALDKGADAVNRRTQGKHAEKVHDLAGRAKKAIEDLGEQPPGQTQTDDGPPGRPPPAG